MNHTHAQTSHHPATSRSKAMPVGALNIRRAYRWHQRLRGLLGTASLPADEALHIRPCNSVHTAGMRYAIDVVFLDRRGQVLKIVPDLAPWRMAVCWRAHSVMELAAGQAGALGLVVGAELEALRGVRLGTAGQPSEIA